MLRLFNIPYTWFRRLGTSMQLRRIKKLGIDVVLPIGSFHKRIATAEFSSSSIGDIIVITGYDYDRIRYRYVTGTGRRDLRPSVSYEEWLNHFDINPCEFYL